MQVDSLSQDDVQTGRTMKRAMGLLAAFAVAMAAALATVDVPEADLAPSILKTDANAQRGGRAAAASGVDTMAPASGELDPALSRPDRGNDHHG